MLVSGQEEKFFIEIAYSQQFKMGQIVAGDTFISRKHPEENRFIAVLSDGLGSGIKANVLSTLTASMAVNYRLQRIPLVESLISIMDTLPKDSVKDISYATCSVVEIDYSGETHIVEFDNPEFILLRDSKHIEARKKVQKLTTKQGERMLLESNLMLFKGDRLIFVSDGVTQSGLGSNQLPSGWERSGLIEFVSGYVVKHPEVSAKDLSKVIMQKALNNDLFEAKDDITCGVVYLRAPRKMLICTGPPYNKESDPFLAEQFESYRGKKVICGGTTAHIIARELNRKVYGDDGQSRKSNLPTSARMDGADLVTEGILTLGHLADLIQSQGDGETPDNSPSGEILKIVAESDIIEFLVGTKINEAHYDPSLPVELEIRRNLIRRLKVLLEEKMMKKVTVKYI